LDPRNLLRASGPQTSLGRPAVHGVFLDAGPDAWGRRLNERERGTAALDNPLEMLRLTNGCGTGALMFSQSRTRPSPVRRVMAFATLEELEATSQAIAAGERVEQSALKLIFEHGSSLGSARPKASVSAKMASGLQNSRGPMIRWISRDSNGRACEWRAWPASMCRTMNW